MKSSAIQNINLRKHLGALLSVYGAISVCHALEPSLGYFSLLITLLPLAIFTYSQFGILLGLAILVAGGTYYYHFIASNVGDVFPKDKKHLEMMFVASLTYTWAFFHFFYHKLKTRRNEFIFDIMNCSPIPTMVYDSEGQIILMNKKWFHNTYYSERNITNLDKLHDFIKCQIGKQEFIQRLCAKSQQMDHGEIQIKINNGDIRYLHLYSYIIRRDRGYELFLAKALDITESKISFEKMVKAQSRLQAVMDAVPVGISYSEDETARKITGNACLLNQFEATYQNNVSASSLDSKDVGRRFSFFQNGRELTADDLPLQAAIRNKCPIPPMTLEVRLPSGKIWLAEASGAPIFDSEGRVIGGVAVTLDVTERERSLELLKKQSELLSIAQKSGRIGIFEVDCVNALTYWTKEMQELLQTFLPDNLLSTEEFYTNLHPDDQTKLKASVEKLATDHSINEFCNEFRYKKGDGYIWIESRGWLVRDAQGHLLKMVGINVDVSERKRLDELELAKIKAEASNQAKNQFIAMMSHEIRTPLSSIIGYSELLSQDSISAAKRAEFSEIIKRNGEILTLLIDDILDLSKIDAGRMSLEIVDVNLKEFLFQVAQMMLHFSNNKGIAFTIKSAGLLPDIISTDPIRLRQILTNVIGNAVKFTHAGGVNVRVEVDEENSKLVFLVSDTGEGLTQLQASRLFQPFMQGDSSVPRRHGGTGLGLILSKKLAQALGGDTILVKSQPGIGSVFRITISLKGAIYRYREIDFLEPKRTAQEQMINFRGLRVLIVEDIIDIQKLMVEKIEWLGGRCEVACNGEEAINMAMKSNFDLILMDIQMPKMDGNIATTTLRQKGYKGPIIAVSAHTMREDISKILSSGCDAHLAKPIKEKNLIDTIRRVLAIPYKEKKTPLVI